jgi:ANTAR domain/GAF domain
MRPHIRSEETTGEQSAPEVPPSAPRKADEPRRRASSWAELSQRRDNAEHLRDIQRRLASLQARRMRSAEAQRLSTEALRRSLDRVVCDGRESGVAVSTRPCAGQQEGRPTSTQMVAALVELALLRASAEHDVCLEKIADACALVFGAAAVVSVVVGPPARPTRTSAQSNDAQAVDGSQIEAGEGPALDAWAGKEIVVSGGLCADPRWPGLARLVKQVPLTSAIAVPVLVDDAPLAVISAYCSSRSAFDGLDTDDLAPLASGTAAVLARDGEYDRLQEQTRQLETALTSRAVIDQAKGIVMAHGGYDADQAFRRLVETSRRNNVKLREVARLIVQRAQAGQGLPVRPRK